MDLKIGDLLLVEGISQKGKNRIREQGNTFKIANVAERVSFSDKSGPWLLLGSLNPNHGRWVHVADDQHWKIVEKLENSII